ncbi:MAG: biotin-dependent carboxyltransferase family protein, partial [bacterium]
MSIRVVTGGLQTTVQDLGRAGFRGEAVPVGGAMDRVAMRAANLLVGNDDGAAGLEAPLIGPALTFDEDTLIAITGADLGATVDGVAVPMWHPLFVERRATLRFGQPLVGCRAYVAVAGGLDVPAVFGSRSTYLRAAFGGVDGRALKSGDILHPGAPTERSSRMIAELRAAGRRLVIGRWSLAASVRPSYDDDVVARVVAGAHLGALQDTAHAMFF